MGKKLALSVAGFILITTSIVVYKISLPEDECTGRDREINNCVPAGKCGPTPTLDAVIDCKSKDYDSKYDLEA